MNSVIEIEDLTKEFDGLVAVNHVTLNVREREIFGFLGPNGAGKTTAVKMLCTILNPTAGSAKVCGYDIVRQRDKVRESVGIVFQDRAIDTFLTGKEHPYRRFCLSALGRLHSSSYIVFSFGNIGLLLLLKDGS